MKNGKSPGIDQIPIEFIKATIDEIKPHLQTIFNYILAKGEYPDKWAQGLRITLPMGKDDFRPITIEPAFSKIFETILDNRLSFMNEAFENGDKHNGGFVKKSMTQDNMLILTGCIQSQLNKGKNMFVAFVDFKKAFNYVNHKMLFYKLIKQGIRGRFLNILKSMYNKLKAVLKINQSLYDWILDKCGTNQGGPLSPNMFRYMLSDLRNFLEETFGIVISDEEILIHILWADDLILMSDTMEGLQKQLDGLFKFCSQFQMIVNELKTKVMIFGKQTGNPRFKFNNKYLDIVKQYKYLGCIFSESKIITGNIFRDMPEYVSEKGMKASFATLKKYSSLGRPTPKVSLHLFDTFVKPILLYGCEIWSGSHENKVIENLQLKYLKLMLGVKSSTCNLATYGETGRFPLYLEQVHRSIKYWVRIIKLDDSKLVKQVFSLLKTDNELGFTNWASKIEGFLNRYGMSNYWNKEEWNEQDSYIFLANMKELVYSKYQNSWFKQLSEFPKMRSYVTFKDEFRLESYLLDIKSFKLRKILAKFRLSSHDLEIEKGRYHKPPIPAELRTCKLCGSGEIENEEHFLLNCPNLTNIRQKLQEHLIDNGLMTPLTLKSILLTRNPKCIFHVAKFLEKAFAYREKCLSIQ